MPKLKTKRAMMKRIKVTGSGKLKFMHSYRRHLAPHKSHKQKMHLRSAGIMHPTDYKRVKFIIG